MKCVAVFLLAFSSVALVTSASVEEGSDPNAVINCYPCHNPESAVCRPLDINQCHTLRIKKCGCCPACILYLREGGRCAPFVETNAECGPGLICIGGACEPKHQLQQQPTH